MPEMDRNGKLSLVSTENQKKCDFGKLFNIRKITKNVMQSSFGLTRNSQYILYLKIISLKSSPLSSVSQFLRLSTLGARVLHAPHPDGRPGKTSGLHEAKAGKTSGLHGANEVSEVLVASDLWFQPSKNSLSR